MWPSLMLTETRPLFCKVRESVFLIVDTCRPASCSDNVSGDMQKLGERAEVQVI